MCVGKAYINCLMFSIKVINNLDLMKEKMKEKKQEILNQNKTALKHQLDKVRVQLKKLVQKDSLYFTKRCNRSLDLATDYAKIVDVSELLIQDQGGWIHYERLAKKKHLSEVRLETKNGLLSSDALNLIENEKDKSLLILNSLPGYSFEEDVKYIQDNKSDKIIFVNDCCGTIGTEKATFGDIVVCSFGNYKPISVGVGGFIAFNESLLNKLNKDQKEFFLKELLEEEEDALKIIDFSSLAEQISLLDQKINFWRNKSDSIKLELEKRGFNVLNKRNKNRTGFNIIVSFEGLDKMKLELERERLIKYLDDEKLEHTSCPRYIRSNVVGVSVEIKKLEYKVQ